MKIFIIGTGNVAASLGRAINKSAHQLAGLAGRDETATTRLAKTLKCKPHFSANKIPLTADIYLVAISDDAIADYVNKLPLLKGIVAHTSGASHLNLLRRFSSTGVFYPVETITKKSPLSFKKVPICVEGSNEKAFRKLMLLAKSLSNEIYSLDSNQRAILHVAAVFANNFTNYLLGIANDLLNKHNLSPALLKTLALSTVHNAFEKGAFNSQTGPAVRNDKITIDKHLKLLANNTGYQQLYNKITGQIKNVHKK